VSISLNVFIACVAVLIGIEASACGPGKKAEKAVIDCVSAQRSKIDATVLELGTKTKPDGSRDWNGIEGVAIAKGLEIGGCALAEFIQSYLGSGTPPGSAGAAPAAAAPPSDAAVAQQTFEHFRATAADGDQFKTRLGTL